MASVLVVGGGIMGLCSAWELLRRKHQVTLVEQAEIPNPNGSSVDEHRLIRFPYGGHAGHTRMVAEAYARWDELFADIGERPYFQTGTLVLAAGNDDWARASAANLESLGHAPEWLAPFEVARRFPVLDASGVGSAFFLDSGGVLFASQIVAALARHLAERGATLLTSTPVAAVDVDAAAVTLADGRRLAADAIVVAAGAWAPRLVPELRARVTPSRQLVAYLEPPEELREHWGATPLILDIHPEQGFYLVPPARGSRLKVGDHRFSLQGDPDRDREPREGEARAVAELCRGRLAGFDRYRVLGARTCFYTVEPDERLLVLGRGRALVVSACSGHAFKFAPAIGTRVAQAVSGEKDAGWVERWAAGEPLADSA